MTTRRVISMLIHLEVTCVRSTSIPIGNTINNRCDALRKIEDEPFFGNLKANLKYLRTSVRGIEKVTTEAGIAIMAANLNIP
nr:transposase [Agrilactobacillus fermenti]